MKNLDPKLKANILSLGKNFAFLEDLYQEGVPLMVYEAMALLGVTEAPGSANNAVIMNWAKKLNIEYQADSIAWCGLCMGYIAQKSGKPVPNNCLWALNWTKWGNKAETPGFGDVLVFERRDTKGVLIGGHVALYIAESPSYFFALGGNTSDAVKIAKLKKSSLRAARNEYNVPPATAGRRIHLPDSTPVVLNQSLT